MRELKLILQGQPMAKQSVRKGKNKRTGKDVYYQPESKKNRLESYVFQINSQLPKGFVMFTKRVHIQRIEFMFEPLAKHLKSKKTMKLFNGGGTIEKTTAPDLHDNLKKLPFDSMNKLVWKDDSLVCIERETSKVFGIQGQITIIIKGE